MKKVMQSKDPNLTHFEDYYDAHLLQATVVLDNFVVERGAAPHCLDEVGLHGLHLLVLQDKQSLLLVQQLFQEYDLLVNQTGVVLFIALRFSETEEPPSCCI